MANRKDYYKILEITEEEKKLPWDKFAKVVKKNYRKLSLKWHPDRHQSETEEEKKIAEENFKNVAEAYAVLSDKDKKDKYDTPGNGGFSFNFGGFDFNPFGFDPFSHFGGRNNNKSQKQQEVGNTIRIEMTLTLEELYTGVEKTIKYKRQEPCDKCNGTGLGENGHMEDCPVCGGTGMEYKSVGGFHQMSTCRHCKGKGKQATSTCKTCGGTGFKVTDHEVTIPIPKGAGVGMQIEVKGEGCLPLSKDGVPGNLIVLIAEKPNDKFVRRGNDLLFELKLSVVTAILGGKTNVTTIDGTVLNTTIPSGSEDGKSIRFANKGMPIYGTENRYGSMIGVVKIEIPKEVTDEEKSLLEELGKQEHFKTNNNDGE